MNALALFCALVSGAVSCRFEVTRAGAVVVETRAVDGRGLEGRIVELSSSTDHACARTDRGRVYCWGDNTAGKLGLGGVAQWQPPSEDGEWHVARATPAIPFPTRPISSEKFVAVSVRGNSSAALSDERTDNAYTWGRVSSIEGLTENAAAFAAASSSTPKRLDLSIVPERRFDGAEAAGIGGFGWSASNVVYRWGDTPGLRIRVVGTVPKGESVRAFIARVRP